MSFPRYPAYKPSGVEWLGQIPDHWGVLQSRRMFKARREAAKEGAIMLTASQKYGMISQAEFVEREGRRVVEVIQGKDNLIQVEPDDFVISMRSFQGGLEWCRLSGSTSFHYVPVTPIKHVVPSFFAHLMKSDRYISALRATTNLIRDGQEIRYSNFVQVPLPIIPESEQIALSSCLDRETAKIDALIAEQQRLIELLQEKRQAVISHAVTKGLNPNAPMKDSGVEWLGEVPEHWNTTPMRRILIKVEQGWSPECLASPAEESEWGVVKAGCVNGGIFNPLNNKTLPPHLEPPIELEIQAGDLLMCRASGSPDLIGSSAYIKEVRPRLLLSDKIFRLRTTEIVDSRYLADVLSSRPLRQQIRQSISGAVGLANNLPQSEIKNFVVPLPPVKEQDEIHEFLAAETERLKSLLDESESLIRLLEERRSALISAAVTGQIDVRGLAQEVAA